MALKGEIKSIIFTTVTPLCQAQSSAHSKCSISHHFDYYYRENILPKLPQYICYGAKNKNLYFLFYYFSSTITAFKCVHTKQNLNKLGPQSIKLRFIRNPVYRQLEGRFRGPRQFQRLKGIHLMTLKLTSKHF